MMGCIGSKSDDQPAQQQVFSWDREDRPDPKDFTIADQDGITCGRKPGTVNGQQFIIQNCKDCSIYIFDHSAMVTVDDCENCKIFLGPIKGSVFIRNSKNCQCVIACQQFRSRDCRKIETFLLCTTQPIIESSANMKFGCFQFYYPELETQFISSGLSVFNNSWSSIHDFTPIQDRSNWSLMSESATVESYIPKPSTEEFSEIDISYEAELSVVPITRGKRASRFDDSCLVAFFAHKKSVCKEFLNILRTTVDFDIMQSQEVKMSVDDALRIFKIENYSRLVDDGALVGLELNGKEIIKHSEEVLKGLGISIDDVFISKDSKSGKSDIDAFYNFVDMNMS